MRESACVGIEMWVVLQKSLLGDCVCACVRSWSQHVCAGCVSVCLCVQAQMCLCRVCAHGLGGACASVRLCAGGSRARAAPGLSQGVHLEPRGVGFGKRGQKEGEEGLQGACQPPAPPSRPFPGPEDAWPCCLPSLGGSKEAPPVECVWWPRARLGSGKGSPACCRPAAQLCALLSPWPGDAHTDHAAASRPSRPCQVSLTSRCSIQRPAAGRVPAAWLPLCPGSGPLVAPLLNSQPGGPLSSACPTLTLSPSLLWLPRRPTSLWLPPAPAGWWAVSPAPAQPAPCPQTCGAASRENSVC